MDSSKDNRNSNNNSNRNSKEGSEAEAESQAEPTTVAGCIFTKATTTLTISKKKTTTNQKPLALKSPAIHVNKLERRIKQRQLKQQQRIARRRKLKSQINIENVTPEHSEKNKQGQESQQEQPKFFKNHNNKNNSRSCYLHHINFFIIINITSKIIALDVLLLQFLCNIFVEMVEWHGSGINDNIHARGRRNSGSSKRVYRSLKYKDNNDTMNIYSMPAVKSSRQTSGNNSSRESNINSGNYNNNFSHNASSNASSNTFASHTSRAIISVATTIASTSASMAIANIPTNLLSPPTITPTSSITIETTSTESYTSKWPFDSGGSGSTWPSILNQSSVDKVNLIELDLANETLRHTYPALRRYHGDYDVSYIEKINPFWLQFEPPTTRTYYIMAVLYMIIASIGCVGNTLVIFMFLRCKSLRTPANTLVINLAVSDLLMLVKCPIAIYNNFKQGPALGDAACRIYGFLGGLSGVASIGTLTAIAIDRYNVVVHPLDPLRKTFKIRSGYIITFIWLYSLGFSIIPALDIGLSVYVPEGFLTTCSFDYLSKGLGARIFMFSFFLAAWCVPFGTICYSYFYILKVVAAANRIQSSKDKNKTEQKLAMIVVCIIALWFAAWTPYSVVAMLGVFGMEEYLTPLGSMIPALFCKTAACIDPYVYAATHPRFRMEFGRLWWGRDHLRRTSTTRSSYVTRSSTRRLRVISDIDMRNLSSENAKKPNNLQVVQEVTDENDEDFDFSIPGQYSDGIAQSRF